MPTSTVPSYPPPAIHVDGNLNPSLTADLLGLTVEESVSAPARCLLRFSNLDSSPGRARYKYFTLHEIAFGRLVTVWQGQPPSTLFRLFHGRVHVIEGVFHDAAPPELHVQAEDALREFSITRRTRVFENMTDAQMMVFVAQDHGLQADISLTSPAVIHAQTAQLNQSDAAFLFDRALAVGAAVWVEQQTLVVTDASPTATPNVLTYGADLVTLTMRADVREQRTVMGVSGWDARTKQVLGAGGSEADLPPATTGLGWSGGRTVEAALGHTREAVVDEVPAGESEAKALAVAHYRARAADFVVGRGVATNAPGLRAGRLIQLAGLGPLFSGAYQITRVCHRFDAGHGLRTEFDVRRDRIGNPGRGSND